MEGSTMMTGLTDFRLTEALLRYEEALEREYAAVVYLGEATDLQIAISLVAGAVYQRELERAFNAGVFP
jgi:hypothetical protein